MDKKSEETSSRNFPKALFSVSREEFYGQDPEHQPLKLTVRDGNGKKSILPNDLQGHVFIIGPVGSVASVSVRQTESKNDEEMEETKASELTVLPSQDGWTPMLNGDGMIQRLDFHTSPHAEEKGQAWLTSRLVKTPAFHADKITYSQPKYRHLRFGNFGLSRYSLVLGLCHQINTAFLPVIFS